MNQIQGVCAVVGLFSLAFVGRAWRQEVRVEQEKKQVEEIDRPYGRVKPGDRVVDLRPTIGSTDGWGIWSSMDGHSLSENTFSNMRIDGPRRHIWSSSNISDRITPFRLENVYAYGNATWDGPLWGARLYNVAPAIVLDSEFAHIGNEAGTGQWEGHALYFNLYGDMTVQDSYFHDLLGQAVQVVWRETETLLESSPRGTITLMRVHVRDAALHPHRGSYPISIFNPGQEVRVNRVSIWSTYEGTEAWLNTRTGEMNRSRGGFGIFWGDGGRPTPKATIRKLNVVLIDPDRATVKLAGVTEVDWVGGYIKVEGSLGRRAKIQIQDCYRGSITGLTGDFEIVHDGSVVAINEDYTWGE